MSDCDYAEVFCENRKKSRESKKPRIIPEGGDGEIRFTFGKYIGQRVDDVLDNDPEYVHWVREKAFSEPLASYIKNMIDYNMDEYDRLRALAAPSMTSEEILFQRALQHKMKYKTFNLERYFDWLKAASNRTKGWLAIKEFRKAREGCDMRRGRNIQITRTIRRILPSNSVRIRVLDLAVWPP